jgi:multidrug efflux pump subunit AcrA (membrane-fusion protein)
VGMTSKAEIVKDSRESALLVPNLAIGIDAATSQPYVQRKTPAGVERVNIKTGLGTDSYSEVTDGLQEGDQVVLANLSSRSDFQNMMNNSFTSSTK